MFIKKEKEETEVQVTSTAASLEEKKKKKRKTCMNTPGQAAKNKTLKTILQKDYSAYPPIRFN